VVAVAFPAALTAFIGVADDRRGIVRKHTGHGREIADVPINYSEEPYDRLLVGGD
jgi:hypothetical protein